MDFTVNIRETRANSFREVNGKDNNNLAIEELKPD